jgi:hypothetical protein
LDFDTCKSDVDLHGLKILPAAKVGRTLANSLMSSKSELADGTLHDEWALVLAREGIASKRKSRMKIDAFVCTNFTFIYRQSLTVINPIPWTSAT